MTDERTYPDEPVGPFDPPPQAFVDRRGRDIEVRRFGDGPVDDDREALREMYRRFDTADRAQGVPPSHATAQREWLDTLLVDDAVNVLAWDDETVAGHAVLVPDDDGTYELAIFVLQAFQGAGLGTRLIRALLGAAEEDGIDRIWLTVERWNHPAKALYDGVGFETAGTGSFELEMALRLA